MEVVILSNNRSPVRVERFCRDLGITYEGHAGKPKVGGFQRAMARMGAAPEETAIVGDQIFTDIWGANRAGIQTVMLEKINPKEEIQIVLKRIPEKFILWRWRKKRLKIEKGN